MGNSQSAPGGARRFARQGSSTAGRRSSISQNTSGADCFEHSDPAKAPSLPLSPGSKQRPTPLFTHSITAAPQDSSSSSWSDVEQRPGVILASEAYGRIGGSDMSLIDGRDSPCYSEAPSSEGLQDLTTSDMSDSGRQTPGSDRVIGLRHYYRPAQTSRLAVESLPEPEVPEAITPRNSCQMDILRTPRAAQDKSNELAPKNKQYSFVIDDSSAGASGADTTSASYDNGANDMNTHLRKLPSYLKIPTAIPRSYTSVQMTPQMPSTASTSTSLSIVGVPMKSGSGTEHSHVHPMRLPKEESSAVLQKTPISLSPPTMTTQAQTTPQSKPETLFAPQLATLPVSDAALAAPGATPSSSDDTPRTRVNLIWRGKGRRVYVTGSFADEWRSKVAMRQLRPGTPFLCTLYLRQGTHRLKFVVDDRWRVSNDLSTATDGDGTLVNYVEIPNLSEHKPRISKSASTARLRAEQYDARQNDEVWIRAMADLKKPSDASHGDWEVLSDEVPGMDAAQWTSEVPRSIELAQETEEALHDNEMGADASALLPSPPQLPRQLEKVILNASPVNGNGAVTAVAAYVDDNSVLPAPNHAVLSHLAASAIKNGVLAMGTVTRYKNKVCGKVTLVLTQYVTTILYRPIN